MKTIRIPYQVSSHEWRCIEEDGTRCPQLRVSRFGSDWSCAIWSSQGDRGRWEHLPERDGCLTKLPQCIDAGREMP